MFHAVRMFHLYTVSQLYSGWKLDSTCWKPAPMGWRAILDNLTSSPLTPVLSALLYCFPFDIYSSMVIRDLTLRSAASFGSFHLIRLLYDEFMFYLVEHKVAAATGETPIAVMGEVRQVRNSAGIVIY